MSYEISYLTLEGVIMVWLVGGTENLQTLISEGITHVIRCSFHLKHQGLQKKKKKHARHAEKDYMGLCKN